MRGLPGRYVLLVKLNLNGEDFYFGKRHDCICYVLNTEYWRTKLWLWGKCGGHGGFLGGALCDRQPSLVSGTSRVEANAVRADWLGVGEPEA